MAKNDDEELNRFRTPGEKKSGKDFLSNQPIPPAVVPAQTVAPPPTPVTALGAAPVAPAPVGADTVRPAASAATITAPPPSPPPPASPTPPEPPLPPVSTSRLEYSAGSNVLRQAARNPEVASIGGAVGGLPRTATPGETPVGGTTAVRNPIASRNLYPAPADQSRILGTDATLNATHSAPKTLAEKQDQNRFDKGFGFNPSWDAQGNPVTATPRQDTAASHAARMKKDEYDIGPYSEDSAGKFGSELKPTTSSSTARTIGGPRFAAAAAEDDSPPGAAPYSSGPLANLPKPVATPKPVGQRLAGAASVLPRSRNQRAAPTRVPQLFAA